jgi:exonuclease III
MSFFLQTYSHEGVCIFVSKNIQLYIINLDQYNKEKDFEICALKLNILSNSFTIICTYRSPTGNFPYFLNQSEIILNKIYKTSTEIILCGDLNINYFNDNSRKYLLDSLLASFSLFSTVKFPTRISNNSCTLIDNIYRHVFSVHPLINGLSAMMCR